ncbi:MAG: hypothetical protein BWY51_00013 [Parcubacteria group bacterium ADurb.Bin316]|nr:MAG: hypothetical protein BWY51_00013 [Parcubacteria group bacterium ADurb.Bin316]HOZ55979.1 hypothetical protein [bacterium]
MIIELKIDKLEEDKAILKSEDNDMVIWPRAKLPKDVKEGTLLAFAVNSGNGDQKTAKDILNEILDVEETV